MNNLRTGNLLGAFVVAIHDQMIDRLTKEDRTAPHSAAALIVIGFNTGCSIEFLSRAVKLSHSGGVRLVDKLERSGLVERRKGRDRRVVELHLKEVGRRRMQSALRSRRKYFDNLLRRLNSMQKAQLTGLIETVLTDITTDEGHAEAMCRYCDETTCPQDCCPITLAVEK